MNFDHYCKELFVSNITGAQKCGMENICEMINSKAIRQSASDE